MQDKIERERICVVDRPVFWPSYLFATVHHSMKCYGGWENNFCIYLVAQVSEAWKYIIGVWPALNTIPDPSKAGTKAAKENDKYK